MTHAAIIGGGIAGAVTAMALQQAGIGATVYEAYPSGADDVGAFLTIMANGMDALRAIDVHHLVSDNAFTIEHLELLSGTGKRLATLPIGGPAAGVGGPQAIRRARLYRVLHDELARRGGTLEHGKRLTAATTDDGTVTATFADGAQVQADVLIGADGVHSATRRLLDQDAPRPRYTGQRTICGYARTAAGPPATMRMMYGRRGFFGYTTAPDGETWWFFSYPDAELSRDEIAETGSDQWLARVTDLLRKDHRSARDIVAASDGPLVPSNGYDIAPVPVWHSPSAVIVGDAAHVTAPNAGHGAAMAIEDSIVLAKCLRDRPSPGDAFGTFERIRRERVERVVALSTGMRNTAAPGPVRRFIRDLVLPRKLKGGPRNTATWLTHHHIDWDSPTTVGGDRGV